MFSTFSAIFEALTVIEDELSGDISEPKRDELIETLLSLRKTMDKCVQYWLKFEERVNQIQERFSITLPDTLPPGFLEEIDLEETTLANAQKVAEKPAEKEGELPAEETETEPEDFYRPQSEITINSFRRAMGFWELAMHKEAVAEFKKVVESEPDLIMGHLCLGLSSAQLGKVEEAFRELKLVLALDQNDKVRALALNTLGVILAGKEEYEQARHYFQQATESDPGLGEAWFNLGATAYNLRQYKEAVEAFSEARKLVPDDWETELHLGRSWGYLGRYKEAVLCLEEAYRLNSREPLITFELGLIYRLLGRQGQAQSYFHATLRLMKVKS